MGGSRFEIEPGVSEAKQKAERARTKVEDMGMVSTDVYCCVSPGGERVQHDI